MENKYGTKVQILHQMGQDIVGSNESILKIEKMICASGCKNLVFTNTALADCFKQRLKGFTVNAISVWDASSTGKRPV